VTPRERMGEMTWKPMKSAPDEVRRDKPVLVLVQTFGVTFDAAERPWLPIAGYKTLRDPWRSVADNMPLTTAVYWMDIPPYPAVG
jgi:hypothetical protein